MIACVFVADYAVVIAREYHQISPDWPLIVATYTKHKGKVYAASPEAKRLGVKVGMLTHKALALCPQAVLVDHVESSHRRAGDQLLEALGDFSDRLELEIDSMGTVWIDLYNLSDAQALNYAQQIRDIVIDQSLFLPAIGVAKGKFASRIAAVTAGEGHIEVVSDGNEKRLLAPLSIERLALKKKQLQGFQLLGINTLGQLAVLPANAVRQQFGEIGKLLHQLANGIDPQPVAAYKPRLKQYRQHQFEPPVDDRMVLETVIQNIAEDLASYMRARGLATQDMTLTLHLDDKRVLEEHFIAREPLASQLSLTTQLTRLLSEIDINAAVASLAVGIENLAPLVAKQLDFFGEIFADPRQLRELADHLSHRYGTKAFKQVSMRPEHSPVPERRFRYLGMGG